LKDDTKACVIREVSRILEEEPRLEAVALSENQRKLSIATLGPDEDHRLADRVSQAVAEGMADCGHLTQAGVCLVCGGKPAAQGEKLARRGKGLSLRSRRIIYQNIGIALGAVIVMMSAAFLFPVPLAFGVAVNEGSTVLVVLNSLRLLFVRTA
jgi:Zn2+/Cd2+-exporting ATPase